MTGATQQSEERARRREATATQRLFAALARLGVDLVTVPATAREALEILERNIGRLREIEREMSRRIPPTAPTPERIAHATTPPRVIEVTAGQDPAHRFDWALEGSVTGLHRGITRRPCACASSRSHPSRRAGLPIRRPSAGLRIRQSVSAITERQEKAAREFHWVMSRLDQSLRGVVKNFVLEVVKHGPERCWTIAEWGAREVGYSGADAAKAAGVATIKGACKRLATLFDAYDVSVREQCAKTDRMMRTDIGQRAARHGWIVALWTWCHRRGRCRQLRARSTRSAQFMTPTLRRSGARHRWRRIGGICGAID